MPGMHDVAQMTSIEVVLDTTDIGGTTATSKFLDITTFGSVTFVCQLGATLEGTPDGWSATDSLDEFHLMQATDSAGSDVKIIADANNDQEDADTGVAGDIHYITINSEQLDSVNDFTHVAALVVEDTNTDVDFVTIVAVRFNPRYAHQALTTEVAHQSVG